MAKHKKLFFDDTYDANKYMSLDSTKLEKGDVFFVEDKNWMVTYKGENNEDEDGNKDVWNKKEICEITILKPTLVPFFKKYRDAYITAQKHKDMFLSMTRMLQNKKLDLEKKNLIALDSISSAVLNDIGKEGMALASQTEEEYNEWMELLSKEAIDEH